jgi:HEAT repeat protein
VHATPEFVCVHLILLGLLLALCGRAIAEQPRDLDFLIKYLARSSNPKVRAQCAKDLEKLGPAAKPAARALCGAMLDPSPSVREAAESALEKVDPKIYWPVRALLARAEEGNHSKATAALIKMKRQGRAAVPILLYHLIQTVREYERTGDKASQMQWTTVLRNERSKLLDSDSIEAMLEKLLAQAVNQLHRDVDKKELEQLNERMEKLPQLIHADLQALAEVGGDEKLVLESIVSMLRSPQPAFRKDALGVLADLGNADAKLRPRLTFVFIRCLQDPSAEIRLLAVQSLAPFGSDADRALPILRRIKASDPSQEVRRGAALALDKLATR